MSVKRLAVAIGLALPLRVHAQATERSESLFVTTASGEGIPYANVSLKGGTPRVTDTNGRVLLQTHGDTLNVVVRRMGFEPVQGKIGRDAATGAFRVALSPNAETLKKRLVVAKADSPLARNGFYDRMEEVQKGAWSGEFFTPEALDARPLPKISQFLSSSRFVKVTQYSEPGGAGITRPRMMLQGLRNCNMTVLLDGVKILLGNGVYVDDLVNQSDVMAIEAYQSSQTAPMSVATRAGNNTCGIVVIWTGARR